jgi:hypothetical protein
MIDVTFNFLLLANLTMPLRRCEVVAALAVPAARSETVLSSLKTLLHSIDPVSSYWIEQASNQ